MFSLQVRVRQVGRLVFGLAFPVPSSILVARFLNLLYQIGVVYVLVEEAPGCDFDWNVL